MDKKLIFGLIIVVLLVVVILAILPPQKASTQQLTAKEANICGDGVCSAKEDCSTCPQDCGCKGGEYCSSSGICRRSFCGDGVCSLEENQTKTCCDDCGCTGSDICNKISHVCQIPPSITSNKTEDIAYDYLSKNNRSGNITEIKNVYYQDRTVKQVTIDCQVEDNPYPCQMILYIDDEGKIVDVIQTS